MTRFALVVLIALVPAVCDAQQDSILGQAMRLASEGQGDSARAYVQRQLARVSTADTTYAEILYAAGVVAGDAEAARMYLRRVSIEFSQSSWADDALLRLAQLAFAEQDYAAALRASDRIVQDYPFSNVFPDANYWAARAHLELGDLVAGCARLDQAAEVASDDIELSNRIRFYRLRCSPSALAARADTGGTTPPARPTGRSGFTVQVAALQSAAAADELMRALNGQGYEDVRVVQEEGYLKVRVGLFQRRQEAARLATELARTFGGKPFVVEER